MAIRVFELARELGVTSKSIMDKCRAEGLPPLKNHMATLTAGLEQTIREWFTEGAISTAVETTQHVDLVQERQKAKRQRRRREAPAAQPPAEEAKPAEEPEAAAAPAEAPEAEEPQPQAEAAVAEAQPAAAEPAEVPAATAPAAEPEVAVAQPAQPAPAPAAAQPQAAPTPPAPPAPAAPVEQAAPATPPAPARPMPPKRPIVKPAGPQLVPRPSKLQGPRVVRMEKPDFVARPPARRRPAAAGPVGQAPPAVPDATRRGPAKPVVVEEEEEGADKKGKKRSPRRRGGRSADSGEVLKEWRNRDLEERSERLAAATGGTLRRHRASVGHGAAPGQAGSKAGQVEVEEPLTIKNISAAAGIKATAIIRKLMDLGTMATVNQVLDAEMARTVLADLGVDLLVKRAKTAEERLLERLEKRSQGQLVSRAPVVTILGHVDHGKTSLLDRIRKTSVAAGEAGGITQHIGAYRYEANGKQVVFLDTPGHEAFTAMRARGANMTDVVVLVVAADDGVMPQTVESIAHAKAAGVPIVVALNKVDLPNANVQKALGQLAEHDLQPREWGGKTEVIQTSAATGLGIDTLLETLSLEAEILELKADKDAPASGYVVEARMDGGMGVLATLLVRSGTLRVGDMLLAGKGYGRVRSMKDSHGKAIDEAGPSTPVEVAGLDEMPEAGDKFYAVEDVEEARLAAEERRQANRSQQLATAPAHDLATLLSKIEAGKATELNLIIKADVQGSIEAITGSLNKMSTSEVRVRVLHAAVGGISTGDVALAEASDAIIIGFNVVPDAMARQLADRSNVEIRHYRIIYDIIDDIRKALEEGLAPEKREQVLGHAEVRQVFKVSRVGSIAGCYVTDGTINRSAKVRITRGNIVIENDRSLESLKRFKDDVRDVRAGFECGLKIAGYDDIKDGDVLEFYQTIEVARKL